MRVIGYVTDAFGNVVGKVVAIDTAGVGCLGCLVFTAIGMSSPRLGLQILLVGGAVLCAFNTLFFSLSAAAEMFRLGPIPILMLFKDPARFFKVSTKSMAYSLSGLGFGIIGFLLVLAANLIG